MAGAAALAGRARARAPGLRGRLGQWLQPQVSIGAREQRDQAVLLLAIAVVVAPHFDHLPLWSILGIGATWIWRAWLTQTLRPAPGRLVMFLLLVLGTCAVLLQYHTVFGRDASVNFLLVLIGLKVLEMRAHRDVLVIVFLSLFVLQTHFLYDQSALAAVMMLVSVGLLFFVLLSVNLSEGDISLPGKLRYLARVFLLALPLTLALFFLFPRLPSPMAGTDAGSQSAGTGLSDSMSPGHLQDLLRNDSVAFRARFDGFAPPKPALYWRGPVFGVFDGSTWWPNPLLQGRSGAYASDLHFVQSSEVDYTVTLEPTLQRELFALELAGSVEDVPAAEARLTPTLELQTGSPIMMRRRYRVRSYTNFIADANAGAESMNEWLQLPEGYNPRTLAWAAEFRTRMLGTRPPASAADLAMARRRLVDGILAQFRSQPFRYDINAPAARRRDTVDEFLFDTRVGYCEHYASAFVVLMRAMGVPARVVTGYQGGEVNPIDGYLTVRQSDAHAWAEVWMPGQGWTRVDPTAAVAPERIEHTVRELREASLGESAMAWPWLDRWRMNREALENAWNQWILSYSAERQRRLISRMGLTPDVEHVAAVAIVVFCALLIALAMLSLRRRRARRDPLADLVDQLRRKLARVRVDVPNYMGLRDMEGLLTRRLDPACMHEGRRLLADLSTARYARPPERRRARALRALRARLRRWTPVRAQP